jgi:hypothetical protein
LVLLGEPCSQDHGINTNTTVFNRKLPILQETRLQNKVIEEVNSFNYLGNTISYEKELDIDNKLHNYLDITGILNNFLGHKIS